jgi:hypothetical protein
MTAKSSITATCRIVEEITSIIDAAGFYPAVLTLNLGAGVPI